MKKIITAAIALTAIVIISCNSDKNCGCVYSYSDYDESMADQYEDTIVYYIIEHDEECSQFEYTTNEYGVTATVTCTEEE